MAKNDNLSDFMTDIANAIRAKKGTSEPINAQDFSFEIASIETGGGGATPSYPNGVYVQHIDGRLFKAEEWTAIGYNYDDANGVAVVTDNASFVMAKQCFSQFVDSWSPYTTEVEGATLTSSQDDAILDYAGKKNTEAIVQTVGNDKYNAPIMCRSYSFPNGQKGYLPAAGEIYIMSLNTEAITSALLSIGGNSSSFPPGQYMWASTQYSAANAWEWYKGNFINRVKNYRSQYAWPCTELK